MYGTSSESGLWVYFPSPLPQRQPTCLSQALNGRTGWWVARKDGWSPLLKCSNPRLADPEPGSKLLMALTKKEGWMNVQSSLYLTSLDTFRPE